MVLVSAAALYGVLQGVRHIQRRTDPMSYDATTFNPVFSTLYFDGLREFDPVSYDDAMHTLTEFSRLYQSSFLVHQDTRRIVEHMHRQRRLFHRYIHTLRQYLPNDLLMEKRLILGIEHTDDGMASCLADIAQRQPSVRLLHGAGVQSRGPRAVDDRWD